MKITIDRVVLEMALAALKKCDSALSEELAAWDIDPPLHHVLEASKACGPSIAALQEALAQPQQEPVAWLPSAEWTACVKLPVTVHVRQQRPGETHVSTREGITPVKLDDLIMRGVSGEEYPIGREIFKRTYRIGEYRPAPETKQEPAWWPAVENILNEYGLQAIDFVADFKAAQAQPQQEIAHWQPVETAPKDGSMLLICLPRQMNLVVRAWYNKIHNFWQTDYEGEGGITRPYYFHEGDLWHPIPSLPAVKAVQKIKEMP